MSTSGIIEASWRHAVVEAMRQRHWSVCHTAREAGIARSTLNHWLKSERRIGSRELARVVAALDCRVIVSF